MLLFIKNLSETHSPTNEVNKPSIRPFTGMSYLNERSGWDWNTGYKKLLWQITVIGMSMMIFGVLSNFAVIFGWFKDERRYRTAGKATLTF